MGLAQPENSCRLLIWSIPDITFDSLTTERPLEHLYQYHNIGANGQLTHIGMDLCNNDESYIHVYDPSDHN